jgi:hypothetical protein
LKKFLEAQFTTIENIYNPTQEFSPGVLRFITATTGLLFFCEHGDHRSCPGKICAMSSFSGKYF